MFHIPTRYIFFLGFVTGTFLSFLANTIKVAPEVFNISKSTEIMYEEWFRNKHFTRTHTPFDTLRYANNKYLLEADMLFKSISILCLLVVSKDTNLKAISDTWGKGCNSIKSINAQKRRTIFPMKDKANATLWIQLCQAIQEIPRDYDWSLIVNDDTFVIMENLRHYLAYRNSSQNFYLGYPVKFWNTVYNLGKAGYVLSKGVIETIKNSACNTQITHLNREDFMLGNFLRFHNISVMDTRDEKGQSVFHPYNLNKLLFPGESNFKFKSVYNETGCCSRKTITFNAMEGDKMYTYYYILYILQLFQDGHLGNRQPEKMADELVWQDFLRKQNLPLNISNSEYYEAWVNLIDSPDSFGRNMKREDYSDNL